MIAVNQLTTWDDVVQCIDDLPNRPIGLRRAQTEYALRRINEIDVLTPRPQASEYRLKCLKLLGEVKRWEQSKQA